MSSKLNIIGKFKLVAVRGEKRMPLRVAESIPCRYQCSFYYKDFIFQTKQGTLKSLMVDGFWVWYKHISSIESDLFPGKVYTETFASLGRGTLHTATQIRLGIIWWKYILNTCILFLVSMSFLSFILIARNSKYEMQNKKGTRNNYLQC